MTSHTRLSPGVEFLEIDRSSYSQQVDNSIVSTTAALFGFADAGEDYTTQWIDSKNTFINLYGYPTNEPETYLYNGVLEILNQKGNCIVSKLPYDNESRDKLVMTTYRLNRNRVEIPSDPIISAMSVIDPEKLTSYYCISADNDISLVTLNQFDQFKVSNSNIFSNANNTITIVDITRHKYGKISLSSDESEILGVMPVIVSPVNAMFFQGMIDHISNPISDIRSRCGINTLSAYDQVRYLTVPLSSSGCNDYSVSKIAADYFPYIKYTGSRKIDQRYLKSIGVVVFKTVRDESNDNRLGFVPVEAFVGQLDRLAKNPDTHASDYIGNIVNANSRYINLFTNITIDSKFEDTSTFMIENVSSPVLGFMESECAKNIDLNNSIMDPLTKILDRMQDPNQVPIDLVIDGGVSNLAQYVKDCRNMCECGADDCVCGTNRLNANIYPYASIDGDAWEMKSEIPAKWNAVQRKFDQFCRYTRKDCIYLADGYRPLVLQGNEKIVRNTNLTNRIQDKILPNMQYVQGQDSSYSVGYLNWFYCQDDYSGDFFWCPPSIKAAGIYIYTDAYSHQWDAPAGLNRGIVGGAFDISFNPRNDEAGRIYEQGWNYATSYPIEGIAIEGQKTMQLNKTALDRVNVRRLMLWIEKRIVQLARRFLYEGNTEYMRQRFTDSAKVILDEAVNGNGVKEYAWKCDDTINTDTVIDNHELRAICAIKPIKTIEWIKVDFIVTNQSANVNEEILND